jgi:hypothetical protein
MAALARSSPEIESLSAAAFLLRDGGRRSTVRRPDHEAFWWIPVAQKRLANGFLLSSRSLSDPAMREEH